MSCHCVHSGEAWGAWGKGRQLLYAWGTCRASLSPVAVLGLSWVGSGAGRGSFGKFLEWL